MKADIARFLRRELPSRGLSAYYMPDGDTYVVHRKGRAVINFNSTSFYDIPKLARNRMWNPLVKTGLAHNVGEDIYQQCIINHKLGVSIV
jgi:hypothetical protein